MLMSLAQLAHQIGAEYRGNDLPFSGVSIDSRSMNPGELFVAIKGEHFDGHLYVEKAIASGAAAVMVDHPLVVNVPQIIVRDTTVGLGKLAQAWRLQFHVPVIALTGSCGKTGTKEMIASILRQRGNTLATVGNKNNFYGLPLTLLQLRSEHQFAVIEMGTNHVGEIAYLTDITRPTVALVTNIRASHLEGFGSFEALSNEKSDIFKGLSAGGIAVINHDEKFARTWQEKVDVRHRVSFGLHTPSDVSATNAHFGSAGATFDLHTPLGDAVVTVPLLGEHVLYNALAAAAATLAVGADLAQVVKGLAMVEAVTGRFKPYRLADDVLLIDDTYNASASSVQNAIQTLSHHSGKKIFVMSNMGELGNFSGEFHRKMGEWALTAHIDQLFLTGNYTMLEATIDACPSARYFADKQTLIHALQAELTPKTMVVIKGSRSNRMEEVVNALVPNLTEELH